jgi:hypothetical protein
MIGFSVATYKEVPILIDGWMFRQKRDAKGRFVKGFDEIPDPNYKPHLYNEKIYGTPYIIPVIRCKVKDLIEEPDENTITRW